MGKQKVNPRRRPATVADVEKAYEMGKRETIEFAIAVACLSVMDIFSPSDEQMAAFHAKYNKNVSAIVEGTIKYQDVLDTLKDEYDLEVGFT